MRIAVLLMTLTLAAGAETPAERGKRIVQESIKALGGERFLTVEDRVESGRAYSFYRSELSGLSRAKIYTRYLAGGRTAKDLPLRERQNFGKNENSGVLFNEEGAWEITFRGARPLVPERIARYRDSTTKNIFYILRYRLNEPGLTIEHQGSDIINNQAVDIVEFNDAENQSVIVHFQQSSKLPVKQMFYRRDPKTRERDEEVTLYSKYRDVGGGVQWPLTIQRERNGEKIFELFSDSVAINQGLTDAIFTLPANLKLLKK